MVGARGFRRLIATLGACGLAFFLPACAGTGRLSVSPEHPVSDPVPSVAAGGQVAPAVAFDGRNFLVVWSDRRNPTNHTSDIYGARVTPSGTVLDPVGIPIGTTPEEHGLPAVAYGGGTFLVVWDGPPSANSDIHGARVGRDGSVLDPTPIPITTAPSDQLRPAVAFGGGSFLVTWADSRTVANGVDIIGSRVTPDGSVLDPDGITISTAPFNQVLPDVAFGNGRFLVTWEDGRTGSFHAVFGARVDRTGTVLDPVGIRISTDPFNKTSPDVAFNGTHFLVAWLGQRLFESVVSGARVSPSGTLLDPADLTILDGGTARLVDPTVAAVGSTFLVAWYDGRTGNSFDVAGARIAADGTNLDPTAPVLWSAVSSAFDGNPGLTLGSDGSTFFASWQDDRLGTPDVFADGIRADGSVVGPGTLVPRAAADQRTTAIGFDGTNHLVVWSDTRSGVRSELLAARISPDGRMLDPSPISVSGGVAGQSPAVAFNGEHFVVAWIEDGGPAAALIHPSGSVTRSIDLPDPSVAEASQIDVASNGSTSFITWAEFGRGGPRVRAARVSFDGQLLDPSGFEVAFLAGSPGVASDGTDFLVAWSSDAIRATRFRADGSVIGPAGFVISSESRSSVGGIAWNGQRYLVVWKAFEFDLTSDIAGTRVARDGAVQDAAGIPIARGTGQLVDPVVASNGGRFLVAWKQGGFGEVADLRATRVGNDGSVVDHPAVAIAASPTDERELSLSAGPDGSWGVAYTRFAPEAPYGSSRAFVRTVSPK